MATNTYVALDTKVLGTAAASVTFTSIPQGYTDLVLVMSPLSSSGQRQVYMEINGDTGSNYSRTILSGTGSSAVSARNSNQFQTYLDYYGVVETTPTNKIIQFMNYSNTTTFKTVLTRSNDTSSGLDAIVHLWRSTAAITQIQIYIDAVNFAVGSTFSLYGIKSEEAASKATGGYVTSDANYYYHTFTASGTFTPTQSISADVLLVAGGGGGGSALGGGGGAGGQLYLASQSLTATGYTVTVGGGGAGALNASGTAGQNTTLGVLTAAVGGGYGAGNPNNGGAGGSGGGTRGFGGLIGGAGTSGQGNAGGTSTNNVGSGGGGAGGAGQGLTTGSNGGNGGAGSATYSSLLSAVGLATTVAGGGGGGTDQNSTAGTANGGGGQGGIGSVTASAGTANTGGGGGGGGYNTGTATSGTSGAGGSGFVVVRYAK